VDPILNSCNSLTSFHMPSINFPRRYDCLKALGGDSNPRSPPGRYFPDLVSSGTDPGTTSAFALWQGIGDLSGDPAID